LKLRRPASKGQAPEPAVKTPATNGSDGRGKSVTLGPNDRLVGQLYIEGDLRVAGTVEGALEATGEIVINDGGRVSGPVTAYDRLVVGSAGSLNGDVRVARLVVEDGATFSGNVSMGKQAVAESQAFQPAPAPVAASQPKPKKR
jgi:cytoskeletal protein CcmA (bactofilin family)